MAVAGLTFLGIGSVGVFIAAILELRLQEPKYRILMKLFPWFMAVGGILLGISL